MKSILWIGKYNGQGFFDSSNAYIEELIDMLDSIQDNARVYLECKYDIDGIAEDSWIPIGRKDVC